MIERILAVAAIGVALSGPASAQLQVSDAWVRASLPHQRATGAFMKLTAEGTDVRLLSASSPAAAVAEIHQMRMEGDIARMARVDGIEISAGETVELRPGAYHLMLMDLAAPLAAGSTVPITLVFRSAGREHSVALQVPVRPLNAGAGPGPR